MRLALFKMRVCCARFGRGARVPRLVEMPLPRRALKAQSDFGGGQSPQAALAVLVGRAGALGVDDLRQTHGGEVECGLVGNLYSLSHGVPSSSAGCIEAATTGDLVRVVVAGLWALDSMAS